MVLSAQTQTTEINIVKNTSTAQQSGQQHKLSEDETAKHYINKCIITPTKKSLKISGSTVKCAILLSAKAHIA